MKRTGCEETTKPHRRPTISNRVKGAVENARPRPALRLGSN